MAITSTRTENGKDDKTTTWSFLTTTHTFSGDEDKRAEQGLTFSQLMTMMVMMAVMITIKSSGKFQTGEENTQLLLLLLLYSKH